MGTGLAIRPAAHAGTFYEADPERLRVDVRAHLDAVGSLPALEHVHGVIVPHAGHIFSGAPAAHAYRLIEGRPYRRAVVIGPSHWEWFEGVATFAGEGFTTPLGTVPIDRGLCERLIAAERLVHNLPRAHAPEHSIEVEIPFLQEVLSDWTLVPLLAAKQSVGLMKQLGELVGRLVMEDGVATLIVASSDLYHGEDVERCRTTGQRCVEALARFDPDLFMRGIVSEEYQACGAGPIAAALAATRLMGATRCEVLAHTDSSETCPSPSRRVVGYLSAALAA